MRKIVPIRGREYSNRLSGAFAARRSEDAARKQNPRSAPARVARRPLQPKQCGSKRLTLCKDESKKIPANAEAVGGGTFRVEPQNHAPTPGRSSVPNRSDWGGMKPPRADLRTAPPSQRPPAGMDSLRGRKIYRTIQRIWKELLTVRWVGQGWSRWRVCSPRCGTGKGKSLCEIQTPNGRSLRQPRPR